MLGLVVWLFTIWCGMHDVYVMVGMVGGMVGMHANDLLMNSSTVSRQTEPNSDLHLKVIFALTKPIVANPPGSV